MTVPRRLFMGEQGALMKPVKIIHTADIHIGASFEAFGVKGAEHRESVKDAFARIVRKAADEGYDLMIIAGDLFDKAFGVPERDISFVLGRMRELSGRCKALILPGSHDFWAPGSVYELNLDRFESVAGVSIVRPGRESIVYPELDLVVHGRALSGGKSSQDPLDGLEPDHSCRWNIAVAHGSVVSAMKAAEDVDIPINIGEVDGGFDYIALGHWHSFREINRGNPPVVYSGSPELIARDQKGSGYIVSLEFSEDGVSIAPERIGRVSVEYVTVDASGIRTTEELVGAVKKQSEPDRLKVVEITFTGLLEFDAAVDFDAAAEELEEEYFSVVIAGALPHRRITREELAELAKGTVVGKFAELLLERIENAEEEERSLYEEALQIGLQLFKGNNPLG